MCIRDRVSETLRELMVNNVASVSEVASKTLIDGYTVGGKSGTAQYWDSEKNRWAEDTYNYTFCGFVGDGIPDLVIVVTVNKPALTVQKRRLMVPKIESYEVFRRVAQTSISVLDLPPDSAPEPADELPGHTSPADSPVRSPDVSPSASPVPIGGR